MTRICKQDWLAAGLQILVEHGAAMLTIERLTAHVGVTKGSFYHHFQGLSGYKHALLQHIELLALQRVQRPLPQQLSPAEPLASLLTAAELDATDWEAPLRAWALQDDEVRAVQERIDSRRNAVVQTLCQQLVVDESRAKLMSHMAQALMIGSTQIQPPITPADRRRLFQELVRLYLADVTGGESR